MVVDARITAQSDLLGLDKPLVIAKLIAVERGFTATGDNPLVIADALTCELDISTGGNGTTGIVYACLAANLYIASTTLDTSSYAAVIACVDLHSCMTTD